MVDNMADNTQQQDSVDEVKVKVIGGGKISWD